MNGPLAGLRGIVLTQAWAGSYCTSLLGLMGADVVQIEVRMRPDSWRGAYDGPLPARLKDVATAEHPWNCNFLYNSVNLNKRCITLDLQKPAGIETFRRLLPFADFVAENFSPRVLGNLGIDYEAMKAIKPDVILCSLSAYGHSGPWANVPGIGGTIEPTSGMSALLGYPGEGPLNSGQMYPDAVAGMNAFGAIIAAIHHRNRTGEGQYIDLSQAECSQQFIAPALLDFQVNGRILKRNGNASAIHAPHGVFQCAGDDKWVAIAVENAAQWHGLREALGNPEWAANSALESAAGRLAAQAELERRIGEWTASRRQDEVESVLQGCGVPAFRSATSEDLLADPQLAHRRHFIEVAHAAHGPVTIENSRFILSDTPADIRRAGPVYGQDNEYVLRDLLGLSEDEVVEYLAAGAVE